MSIPTEAGVAMGTTSLGRASHPTAPVFLASDAAAHHQGRGDGVVTGNRGPGTDGPGRPRRERTRTSRLLGEVIHGGWFRASGVR